MFWDPALNTGIEAVDRQHRKLVSKVEQFYNDCTKEEGIHSIGSMLRFLGEYVNVHFSLEEELFENTQYPDADAHKEVHEEFKLIFQSISEQIGESEPSLFIVESTKNFLMNWLLSHISGMDMDFANYSKNKPARKAVQMM